MTAASIVVGGDALVDLIATRDGTLTPVPGGGSYNTARTIGRLGGRVGFLGRIADDHFGRLLREGLEADGVATHLVVTTSDPSTLVVAEIDDAGVPEYRFYVTGTAAPGLRIEDARRALSPLPWALHVGTLGLSLEPIADALATIVDEVPPQVLVMVDPNCRPATVSDFGVYRKRMLRVLGRADIVKVSREDLEYLSLAEQPADAARRLIQAGSGVVIVTQGADPVAVMWPGGQLDVPVPRVPVVDTVGAGDAFGGGFLAYWLERGHGRGELRDAAHLEDATRFAVRVAALTCQRAGAEPPRRAELA